MKTTIYDFTGGMADASPAFILSDNTAADIVNMKVSESGALASIPEWIEWLATEEIAIRAGWVWKPLNMPSDAADNIAVVIVTSSDQVKLCYRAIRDELGIIAVTETLAVVAVGSTVRTAQQPEQFLFVDGLGNNQAKRIVIDSGGNVSCILVGAKQPTTPPVILSIDNDIDMDNEFTGMPVGSILFYSYCIVNEFGERSNPSPITVEDGAQFFGKKDADDGTGIYAPTRTNKGSIKSVLVRCHIPDRAQAKAIELYRSDIEYSEGNAPVPIPTIVAARTLGYGDGEYVNIMDTSFPGTTGLNYENDSAPTAADIAVSGNTIFLANTGNDKAFPFATEKAYAISITNSNPVEYVNRWFRIALNDSTSPEGVRLLPDAFTWSNKHRIIDEDRITPLTVYYMPTPSVFDEVFIDTDTPQWRIVSNVVYVKIPLIAMNSTKTIYLVLFQAEHPNYGEPFNFGGLIDMHSNMDIKINAVRDINTMHSYGISSTVTTKNGYPPTADANKANANVIAQSYHGDTYEKITTIGGLTTGEYLDKPFNAPNKEVSYDGNDSLKRYTYSTWIKFKDFNPVPDTEIDIITLPTAIIHAKTLTGNIMLRFQGTATSYGVPIAYNGAMFLSVSINTETQYGQLFIAYVPTSGSPLVCRFEYIYLGTNPSSNYEWKLEMNNYYMWTYLPFYSCNLYITSSYDFIRLMNQMPIFPVSVIGTYGIVEDDGNYYLKNENITASDLQIDVDNKPGRIRWSRGGSIPELREQWVKEDITAIYPIQSFAPTDEHNTLLVWTRNDLFRLALLGDDWQQSQLVPEIRGLGAKDKESVCGVHDGVIWCTYGVGIYYLRPSGLTDISSKFLTPDVNKLLYLPKSDMVLMLHNSGKYYLYNLKNNTYTRIASSGIPGTLLSSGNVDGNDYVVASKSGKISVLAQGSTMLPGYIKTKQYRIGGKLNRIKICGPGNEEILVTPILIGSKIAGGQVSTPSKTMKLNQPTGIKGMHTDYLQIEINNINNTTHIEFEGGKNED